MRALLTLCVFGFMFLFSCGGEPQKDDDMSLLDADSSGPDQDGIEEIDDQFTYDEDPFPDEDTYIGTDDQAITWVPTAGTMNTIPGRFQPVQMIRDDELWVLSGLSDPELPYCFQDIWTTNDGMVWRSLPGSWELINENTFGPAGTVHNGKLFVITNTIFDDYNKKASVMSSSGDGIWNLVYQEAPFGPRAFPIVFSLDGRLWVIGGYDKDLEPQNDIWSSASGTLWETHGDYSFPFPLGGTPILFKDRIWIIGGNSDGIPSSGDGLHWELQPVTAPFVSRTGLAVAVHKGQLYAAGGADGDGALAGLWRSADGVIWEQLPTEGLPKRMGAVFASLQGTLVMTAGMDEQKTLSGTTHYSIDDGHTWQVLGQGQFTGRSEHAFLHTDKGFYIIGGIFEDDQGSSVVDTVYYSPNGYSWEQLGATQPLLNKTGMAFAYFKGRIWGIGGHVSWRGVPSEGTTNEIVVSDDGETWTVAAADPELTPRWYHRAVVFQDRLWVVGGFDNDGDGLSEVWSSGDAITWRCEQPAAAFIGRGHHGLLVLNDKLYLIGGQRYMFDDGISDVWRSNDGVTWEELVNIAFPRRVSFASAAAGDALWVFGGEIEFKGVQKDLWFSVDGKEWQEAAYAPDLSARRGASLLGVNDRLWLAGGISEETSLTNLSDVWYADLPADLLP